MSSALARTSGIMEGHCAPQSGLQNRSFRFHLVSGQTANVSLRPIGGRVGTSTATSSTSMTDAGASWPVNGLIGHRATIDGKIGIVTSNTATVATIDTWRGGTPAAVSAYQIDNHAVWVPLTLVNRDNPFCSTLVAQVIQTSAAASATIRLRIRGFDQFGRYQEELTPVVTLATKTNNFVYCAKCFSYLISVEYLSTLLDVAGDTLSLGQRWDWTRTNDATNEHLAGRNLAMCVPIRLARLQGATFRLGRGRFEQRKGPTIVTHNIHNSPPTEAVRSFQPPEEYPERVAIGFVDLAANPADADTVTIDGVLYTFKTVLTATAGDVLIGATRNATLKNLRAAIDAAGGLAGVTYGANTTAHPTVYGAHIADSASGEFLDMFSRVPGTLNRSISITSTGANVAVSAFGGGYDAPFEVQSLTVFDLTGIASASAITHNVPTQWIVGHNEAGWEGPVEKLHIHGPRMVENALGALVLETSSVPQWAIADNVLVTMHVRSLDRE